MFDFFALLSKKNYWKIHSYFIKIILKIYGVKVGKNFYCEGVPRIKINGKANNIIIADNVNFLGNVDLRNRENGKILINDNVTIEDNVRIVSARDGIIKIGMNSSLNAFSILNGGADIIIGSSCLIGARVSINSNEHEYKKNINIKDQGFILKPVIIGDDCLVGVNVAINKGVIINKGSIIGANSVVTKDTKEYSVNVGVPSVNVGFRS